MKRDKKSQADVLQPGQKVKARMTDFFKLTRHVKFNWVLILLALAASIAESLITGDIPDATANLFDGDFSMGKLWRIIGNLGLVLLLFSITSILMLLAQSKSTLSARKSVWEKLMNVKMSYYDTHDPNSMLNTVTVDAELVSAGLISLIVKVLPLFVLIAKCLKMVSGYHYKLLILMAVIVAIHIIYMVAISFPSKKVAAAAQIQVGFFTGFLAERIRNFPVIKAFGTQYVEYQKGSGESKKLFKIGQKTVVINTVQSFYQAFIYLLGTVITVFWCCALIQNGEITVVDFIAVNTYIMLINVIFMTISIYWLYLNDFGGRAYRIARLCEAPQETDKNKKIVTEDGEIKVSKAKTGKKENGGLRITVSVKGFEDQTERLNELVEILHKYKDDGEFKFKTKQGKKHLYLILNFKNAPEYKACAKLICELLQDADKNVDISENDIFSVFCKAVRNADKPYGITDIEDGDIKFRNVDFGYSENVKIIKNASFTVPQGKITALVGPSGSGKTTIVKLLENLYSPTAGSITIGNQNIDELNVQAWRRKLAYVVQDAGIFSGSLRDCLTYGVEREVSDEEIVSVTKLTGLFDWIETQPLKFMTPVASWGASMSGGQRQRVVISRALLRNADVLIFDEPTSALDPETANAISKMIFETFTDKTVIIISHELNYIAKAANIVFLHDGVIEGEGEHLSLMKDCEAYRSLVEQQSYQEVFGE